MNKFLMSGRLTRDAVARATSNGKAMVGFTVAVNRNYKNADGTVPADFIGTIVYCKDMNVANKFADLLKKGTGVEVEGTVQSRTVDLADGTKNTVLSVVADRVGFPPSNNKPAAVPAPAPAPTVAPTPVVSAPAVAVEVNDDDLPF